MGLVFIPNNAVQAWLEDGRAILDKGELYLLEENLKIPLVSAVRFLEVVAPDEDTLGLVGKIKTTEQLEELDAEHFMDSVTIGEIAYTVIEGSRGELATEPIVSESVQGGFKRIPTDIRGTLAPPEMLPEAEEKSGAPTDEEAAELSRLFLNTVR
jgi:hypothetical protein